MKTFDVNNIQLKIQSPGMTVPASLENFLIAHIEKLGKIFPRIKKCETLLREQKDSRNKTCKIEAKLFIPRTMLFAADEADNFEFAAKNMFDDLRDQLLRYKEKVQKKNNDGIARTAAESL